MMETSTFLATKRCAVVSGSNKGIGLEICKQLASNGVTVVLTARNENKGIEAVEILKWSGLSDYVVFHQLDVVDPCSIASLAEFIRTRFGKLDILVNNAAIVGVTVDCDAVRASAIDGQGGTKIDWSKVSTQTYDSAEECLKTNYHGAKGMIEALAPLLQLSDSARIVNISSSAGKLKFLPNEWAKVLNDAESLTEGRIDEVLHEFLNDFKAGLLETKGWSNYLYAYKMSKAAMNAYTRILAKKYPNFIINSVCPGYVKTQMNFYYGNLTVEEGAESPVWLALLPNPGHSGLFFYRKEQSPF